MEGESSQPKQPLLSNSANYKSLPFQGTVPNNAAHVNSTHHSNKLSILYYNARSVLPKLDELKAVYCTCAPDIVCIVESWVCGDIGDNEISLPNYSFVRLDRSRHGGGILMYIKDHDGIPFSIVASGPAGL